jgi:putative transposase
VDYSAVPQGLPKYNYPVGTIIEIDGRPYKPPVHSMPGRLMMMDCHTGQPFLVPDGHGGTCLPTEEDYDGLIGDGRLEVRFPDNVISSRLLAAKAEFDMSDLEGMDPGVRKVKFTCDLLDENGVKNGYKAVKAGLERLWTEEIRAEWGDHDNPHTVKRWRSERGRPGERLPKLMVRLGGNVPRAPYLDDVPQEIKQKHALDCAQTRGRISASYTLAATELREVNEGKSALYAKPDEPYPIFSYDTFRRACHALDGSEATAVRDGKQMVEAVMRGGGKPLTAGRILEKVIIDHTPLSAFLVVDPDRDIVAGKAWLTFAIDVHSRAILAWVITYKAPSYWTVCEVLRRMNLPKRPPPADALRYPVLRRICGKPTEIILDNASEFTGHGLEDAAKSASFSVRFCPLRMPRYRAIVERAHATLEGKMLEHLPGATGNIAYRRKSGHNPEDLACVMIEEIEALGNKSVAEYHTEVHESIGVQPALKWQKSANTRGIDVMGDTRRFRLDTLDVRINVKVTKSGVRIFNGLRYFCARGVPRLIDNNLRFEGRRQVRVDATIHTKVKFDPENIAVIHAWDKTTRTYVELRCQDETYADGMPLWFHEELVRLARKEATAEPPETARPRARKVKVDPDAVPAPTLRRLSEGSEDEVAPKGFNTEAERLEARARRIAYIRGVAPGARLRQRNTLAKLYEIPRLRQITGNIVHLDTDYSQPISDDDFISHDPSSLTTLDAELLADRPEKTTPRRTARDDRRDSRDAGKAKFKPAQPSSPHEEDDVLKPSRRRGNAA